MRFLDRILGRDPARAARTRAAADAVREALDAGRTDEALERARLGLLDAPDDPELLRLTSAVLLRRGERSSSELFARAADAPDDLARMVELGSHLLSREAPQLACAFLARALSFAPFDAVIRSELAIAQARSGRPREAVETLALHPCLADDPGALFEFAWASLLSGDLESAEGAREELRRHRVAGALLDKLDCSLRRAQVSPAGDPPDARDFLFLEHGSILLELEGPHRGRHGAIELGPERQAALLARAVDVIRELLPRPHRIVAAERDAAPLADLLAEEFGAERAPLGAGTLPPCVVVARRAQDLEPLGDRLRSSRGTTLALALTLDWSRALSEVPDLVGVLARDAQLGSPPSAIAPVDDPALLAFVRARRPHIPPAGRRTPTAYLPDAPLPWP